MLRLLTLSATLLGALSFPAIGADSPRRMLVLHGSGTTAGAFVNSPTTSGAKKFLSGVPCRQDAGGGSGVPPNWQWSALDAGSPDGSWWSDEKYSGLQQSIANVEAEILEQQAVGIVGHEQGATLAAIVAARSILGEGVPLKFAVCCGAEMPTAGPYADLLNRLRDLGASMPTLHCISTTESIEATEELAACFAPSAEILRHGGGSAMPGPSWWEETQGYPERVTGGLSWVTQARGPFRYKIRKGPPPLGALGAAS